MKRMAGLIAALALAVLVGRLRRQRGEHHHADRHRRSGDRSIRLLRRADAERRANWPSRTSTPRAACSARSSTSTSATTPAIPKQAVAVANQMTGSGVALVAGHYCSGSSIPASKVYAESDMVQISPASTNPAFTDDRAGPNIYRVCGRDDQQGGVAGKYLAKTLRRQEHRHHPRQDRLRQRHRRRDQEGAQRRRQAGGAVRGHHRRREGLFGAGLQAEAGQYRCAVPGRLPHRGRA